MSLQNKYLFCLFLYCAYTTALSAQSTFYGIVLSHNREPISAAAVSIDPGRLGGISDSAGRFLIRNVPKGKYRVTANRLGFIRENTTVHITENDSVFLEITMTSQHRSAEDVVVTGTMQEISKADSPIPVEVFTSKFFQKNPSPTIFDALQNVNGVRPQINCSVCNTGDIHINGMEGPYTMILLDGMPIVSGLASVYGLFGIPNGLIDRIEIVKGPASSLYGSEAMGGLINIITKAPAAAPKTYLDLFSTSWKETSADVGIAYGVDSLFSGLTGINYFRFQDIFDNNNDNFTDVALQHRISIFNTLAFTRSDSKKTSIAGRFIAEDRWGGDVRWNKQFRAGDSLYGENIETYRWEILGTFQLPTPENIVAQFSVTGHQQMSAYGTSVYNADQYISFGQLYWEKKTDLHNILVGAAMRYTLYDDNTAATANIFGENMPNKSLLPGIFLQDEMKISDIHSILLGMRYDYHQIHNSIISPRLAYKFRPNPFQTLRLNFGSGFRVVNIFAEEHAALTGARTVVFRNELQPEKSLNGNLNYTRSWYWEDGNAFVVDASLWLTHFSNKITPDYEVDPNSIVYDNLRGYGISRGGSIGLEYMSNFGLKINSGATIQDIFLMEEQENGSLMRRTQLLTESWMATWTISYELSENISLDYTGNIYGSMLLPILGDLDPRPRTSPVWSIQNFQITLEIANGMELYGGAKNLLNWTPADRIPFLISRSNDPFDKNVEFDSNGRPNKTIENPYALTFDPSYVYAPNQGRRAFLGVRWKL